MGVAAARGIGVPSMPHGRDAHATLASAEPASGGGKTVDEEIQEILAIAQWDAEAADGRHR